MKVGVIGAGFQGRLHVEHLSAIEDVEVVAVCDTDAARVDAVGAAFGVTHVYEDYRRLLDAHDLDLVTICTMPVMHREMTVDALAAGAHVLCEKPLAMNATEGRAMLDAAAAAGRLLTVGFNLRHTRSAQILMRFVESGRFGAPVYTRAWAKASSGVSFLDSAGALILDVVDAIRRSRAVGPSRGGPRRSGDHRRI